MKVARHNHVNVHRTHLPPQQRERLLNNDRLWHVRCLCPRRRSARPTRDERLEHARALGVCARARSQTAGRRLCGRTVLRSERVKLSTVLRRNLVDVVLSHVGP